MLLVLQQEMYAGYLSTSLPDRTSGLLLRLRRSPSKFCGLSQSTIASSSVDCPVSLYKYTCNVLNSSAWDTADFAAWNSQYLSRLRPLWLILVSPLCLPELLDTRPRQLSFRISLASSKGLISPISARIPARMFSPIPSISRIFSA